LFHSSIVRGVAANGSLRVFRLMDRVVVGIRYHRLAMPSHLSLWRRVAVLGMLGGLVAGGCALDVGRVGTTTAESEPDIVTGSIASTSRLSFSASEMTMARIALAEAFARDTSEAAVPWSNAETGARGTVTAVSVPRRVGNDTCRDFLASRVDGQKEVWLRGTGCRPPDGQWQVKALAPLGR
jgi:surface antigen